jgi:hypothetical protein
MTNDNDEYGLIGKIDKGIDIIDDVSNKDIDIVSDDAVDIFEPMLQKNCSIKDVTKVIIDQINGIQYDIKSLEKLRQSLSNIFPSDAKSYRNSYIIENKVKTFTGFYTTILSYKKELNFLLLKLRDMLNTGGSVEEFKQALKEVLSERTRIQNKTEENKTKIESILKDKPNLMPKSL